MTGSPVDGSSPSTLSTPIKQTTTTKSPTKTPPKTSYRTELLTPSKTSPSTPAITLTPTKSPSPPSQLSTPLQARPKRQSGFIHIKKLFSILREHTRNVLLRDYFPGKEPEGLEGYDDAIYKFVAEERWNIRVARARLTWPNQQNGHQYNRSVIPTISVEDMGPPSPIDRFWAREKGDVQSNEWRAHSRYHSM